MAATFWPGRMRPHHDVGFFVQTEFDSKDRSAQDQNRRHHKVRGRGLKMKVTHRVVRMHGLERKRELISREAMA